MTASSANVRGGPAPWTRGVWAGAIVVLLAPLIAMQFTPEVNWSAADFFAMGAMLAAGCGTIELATRRTGNGAYRAAVGVAVLAAFLLIWLNLAVGIIGSEGNPANLMFGGVLAIAVLGAAMARLKASGMALAFVATAVAQGIVGLVALTQMPSAGVHHEPEVAALTAFFAGLWLLSAWLFRQAAQRQRAP